MAPIRGSKVPSLEVFTVGPQAIAMNTFNHVTNPWLFWHVPLWLVKWLTFDILEPHVSHCMITIPSRGPSRLTGSVVIVSVSPKVFPTDHRWGEEAKSTSVDHKDLQFMPYLAWMLSELK